MPLSELLLGVVGLVIAGVALFSVITAFLPARHPEAEERFGSRRRIEREMKDRRKASWFAH